MSQLKNIFLNFMILGVSSVAFGVELSTLRKNIQEEAQNCRQWAQAITNLPLPDGEKLSLEYRDLSEIFQFLPNMVLLSQRIQGLEREYQQFPKRKQKCTHEWRFLMEQKASLYKSFFDALVRRLDIFKMRLYQLLTTSSQEHEKSSLIKKYAAYYGLLDEFNNLKQKIDILKSFEQFNQFHFDQDVQFIENYLNKNEELLNEKLWPRGNLLSAKNFESNSSEK